MTTEMTNYNRETDVFYRRQRANMMIVIILSLGQFGERNKRVVLSLLAFSIVAWISLGYQLLHKDSYLRYIHERELRRMEIDHLFSLKFAMGDFSNWSKPIDGPIIAVLVLTTCNQATARRPLAQLLAFRPSAEQFPIIVSADCNDTAILDIYRSYGNRVTLIEHPQTTRVHLEGDQKMFANDYNIARHYGWSLNKTFLYLNYKAAIVVEDNLEIAPDFFSYFESLLPVLESDPTLYCVSAWNDNGKANLVDAVDIVLLHRSDFFPGFSWMLTRHLWIHDLMKQWPQAFWDNWMREPAQSKDRSCIRPEISRVKAVGTDNSGRGQFSADHLKRIHLNGFAVNFLMVNVSYLLKENYDLVLVKQAYLLPVVDLSALLSGRLYLAPHQAVRIVYSDMDSFRLIAKAFGLSDTPKSRIPPTAYRGIVTFKYYHRRVFLTPPHNWTGYDHWDDTP